jgi:hypothetical protein
LEIIFLEGQSFQRTEVVAPKKEEEREEEKEEVFTKFQNDPSKYIKELKTTTKPFFVRKPRLFNKISNPKFPNIYQGCQTSHSEFHYEDI